MFFMDRKILTILVLLMQLAPSVACKHNEQKVDLQGPQGKISCKVLLPDGFDPTRDQVPMVILMHGIFAGKDFVPIPHFARGLAKAGIASVRLDFNGHGQSEGRMQDMTIEKELADARAVWEYVQTLPYVSQVGLLGHSQGGVIASMTAGRLAAEQAAPDGVVLVAPGSVIKEACQGGKFFNARFNPQDPPEFITCWGFMRLGREYLLTTQQLDIFGTAAAYHGPVLLLHGDNDNIVPLWCSEKYLDTYGKQASLRVIHGVNHTITAHRDEVVGYAVDFFRQLFGK